MNTNACPPHDQGTEEQFKYYYSIHFWLYNLVNIVWASAFTLHVALKQIIIIIIIIIIIMCNT